MSGYLGASDMPMEHHGEQVRFEQRTSDPTTTVEGEAWIRVDLAPETNQLGTLRFDAGSEIWDIPVYKPGTSPAEIEEVLRIPISGTVGFIPVTDTSPAYRELGFQHAGTRLGLHDSLEISAIPDKAIAQYDASTESSTGSISTIPDQIGSSDLTGTLSIVDNGVNGNRSYRFDGTGDSASGSFSQQYEQPNEVIVVAQMRSFTSGENDYIFDSNDSSARTALLKDQGDDEWTVFSGSLLKGSSVDTNVHIFDLIYDGASSALRIDDTDDITGDSGSDGFPGLTLGDYYGGGANGAVDIAELDAYETLLSTSERESEHQRLADKWDITL